MNRIYIVIKMQQIQRHIALLVLVFGLTLDAVATEPKPIQLILVVEGVKKTEGQIGFQLMDAQQNVLESWWVPVRGQKVSTTVTLEYSGDYSVRFFHDQNSNNEMDFYWYGPPKEPYGNSNDVRGNFGPPIFSETIFTVVQDMTMTMKLL